MCFKKNHQSFIKRQKKINLLAHLYIQCAFKNTIISLTDSKNKAYKQWSCQSSKKTTERKKNTPYNLYKITKRIQKYMMSKKIRFLKFFIKGKGFGRYHIIKNINRKRFKIIYIFRNSFVPFNGCRLPKKKRR
jgi:small subunit ribosomal protein S11